MKKDFKEENLNKKTIIIVDYENYQGISLNLLNMEYVYYLFCGTSTKKSAVAYKAMLKEFNINIICSKHSGTNFVDNRISMFIGYIFGRYNPKQVVLVSNDIDFFEMKLSLQENEFPFIIQEPNLKPEEAMKRLIKYFDVYKVEKEIENNNNIEEKHIQEESSKTTSKINPDDVKLLIKKNGGKLLIRENDLIHYIRKFLKLKKAQEEKIVKDTKEGGMQIYKFINL